MGLAPEARDRAPDVDSARAVTQRVRQTTPFSPEEVADSVVDSDSDSVVVQVRSQLRK